METTQDQTRLLTVREVAIRLALSEVKVRRLQDQLGVLRLGRAVRFDPERVNVWIAERQAEADRKREARER